MHEYIAVMMTVGAGLRGELAGISARQAGLRLLVLFGSRARGDAAAQSDWDFAYLAANHFDPLLLLAKISRTVHGERIDLVDLARAGGLLRYRVARDGELLFETAAGQFDRFCFEAARFWFDAEPVLRPAYEDILERLG